MWPVFSYVDSAAETSQQSLDQPGYSAGTVIITELNKQQVKGILWEGQNLPH